MASATPGRPVLSARERHILRLMADGLSNEAIADALGIAIKTVETAVRSLFTALQLDLDPATNRRVLAVRWYLRDAGTNPQIPSRPAAPFVGRERDLTRLGQVVSAYAMVTLVGVGGSGKSRLALELAHRGTSGREAVHIDLSPSDPTGIWDRVRASFGLAELSDGGARRLLASSLAAAPHLLVLDNAEHAVDEVAELLPLLLSAPTTRVLVTSRVPLGVPGETVWRLPALSLAASVDLFAQLVGTSGSVVSASDAEQQVEHLGGLPLAIQLTSVQFRMQADRPPEQTDDDQPTTDGPPVVPRLVESALTSVGADATALAHALTAFPSGLDLALLGSALEDADPAVAELVSRSLVETSRDRIRMLEPVRQSLRASMTAQQRRSADRVLVRTVRTFAAQARLGLRHDPVTWRPRLARETETVDAAITAALRVGAVDAGVRIATGATEFWADTSPSTAYRRLEPLLARTIEMPDASLRASALLAAGELAALSRRSEQARRHLAEADALFAVVGDRRGQTQARFLLARDAGDSAALTAAMHGARELGLPHLEALALLTTGREWMRAGREVARAMPDVELAERVAERHRLPALMAYARLMRAEIMLHSNWRGETPFPEAEIHALLEDAGSFMRSVGSAVPIVDHLSLAGTAAVHHERWDDARRSILALLAWSPLTEDPVVVAESVLLAAAVLDRSGDVEAATQLAQAAGPTFALWADRDRLRFTMHPRRELGRLVVASTASPLDVEQLDALVRTASDRLRAANIS